MFLPFSDQPNCTAHPWVTYCLLSINIFVFMLIMLPAGLHSIDLMSPEIAGLLKTLPEDSFLARMLVSDVATYRSLFVHKYGYHPGDPACLSLITGMFLHGGFLHLFNNMLFLFIFGDNVEARLGHFRFFLFYLFCGIMGAFAHTILTPETKSIAMGASAAVTGILGYYFFVFANNKVKVFTFLFPFFIGMLLIPSRLIIGVYFLVGDVMPFITSLPMEGGASHAAHLAGFVSGTTLAVIGKYWSKARRQIFTISPP